jgi:hypothetical protein
MSECGPYLRFGVIVRTFAKSSVNLFTSRTDRELIGIARRYPFLSAERSHGSTRYCRFNDFLFANVMGEAFVIARFEILCLRARLDNEI